MFADMEPAHICRPAHNIAVYNFAAIRQLQMIVGCLLKLHCPSILRQQFEDLRTNFNETQYWRIFTKELISHFKFC